MGLLVPDCTPSLFSGVFISKHKRTWNIDRLMNGSDSMLSTTLLDALCEEILLSKYLVQ